MRLRTIEHGRPPALGHPPAAERHRGVAITEHRIELVARDELGSIVTLFTSRGAVDAQTAAAEIASGRATYVTGPDHYVRAFVTPISSPAGVYLYANWEGTRRNNLHDLSAGKLVRLPVAAPAPRTTVWMRLLAAMTTLMSAATRAPQEHRRRPSEVAAGAEPTRRDAVLRARPHPFAPVFLDLIRPHGVTPRRQR